MKWLRDESGVALMMTMMVSAVALAVMATLMYVMVMGTRSSGLSKRFTTALEAGKGGQSVVLEYIGTRGNPDNAFMNSISWATTISNTCLADKLNKATENWTGCDSSLVIDASDDQSYDFKFDLGSYTIYSKIVNTIEGNTGPGTSAKSFGTQGVVTAGGGGGGGTMDVVAVPYLYTMELDSRRGATEDGEKAKLSLLYQY